MSEREADNPAYDVTCHSCRKLVSCDLAIPDEGDAWWCLPCVRKWEEKEQCHFENGQPFTLDDKP